MSFMSYKYVINLSTSELKIVACCRSFSPSKQWFRIFQQSIVSHYHMVDTTCALHCSSQASSTINLQRQQYKSWQLPIDS
jgi:hypothetical protein